MSSLSITALSAFMLRWPAVITSALLALSAQMVAVPPASEMVAAPVAAPACAVGEPGDGVLPWALGCGWLVGWRLSSALSAAVLLLLLPLLLPDICSFRRVA